MIDARLLAIQGIGYAPYAMAVQGALAIKPRAPALEGTGPDDDPVYDWRYGIHPAFRRTGDRLQDLREHLRLQASQPLQGDTELERQEAKLARTFKVADPEGVVDVPLFKPMLADLPADLAAKAREYAAEVQAEINDERIRILLLLSD